MILKLLQKYLSAKDLKHKMSDNLAITYVNNPGTNSANLSDNKQIINDLEINKGSLNDVFLAITEGDKGIMRTIIALLQSFA